VTNNNTVTSIEFVVVLDVTNSCKIIAANYERNIPAIAMMKK
jgi:hypothetical protein